MGKFHKLRPNSRKLKTKNVLLAALIQADSTFVECQIMVIHSVPSLI